MPPVSTVKLEGWVWTQFLLATPARGLPRTSGSCTMLEQQLIGLPSKGPSSPWVHCLRQHFHAHMIRTKPVNRIQFAEQGRVGECGNRVSSISISILDFVLLATYLILGFLCFLLGKMNCGYCHDRDGLSVSKGYSVNPTLFIAESIPFGTFVYIYHAIFLIMRFENLTARYDVRASVPVSGLC